MIELYRTDILIWVFPEAFFSDIFSVSSGKYNVILAYFTKDFHLAEPVDSCFWSLGLPGYTYIYIIILYNIYIYICIYIYHDIYLYIYTHAFFIGIVWDWKLATVLRLCWWKCRLTACSGQGKLPQDTAFALLPWSEPGRHANFGLQAPAASWSRSHGKVSWLNLIVSQNAGSLQCAYFRYHFRIKDGWNCGIATLGQTGRSVHLSHPCIRATYLFDGRHQLNVWTCNFLGYVGSHM